MTWSHTLVFSHCHIVKIWNIYFTSYKSRFVFKSGSDLLERVQKFEKLLQRSAQWFLETHTACSAVEKRCRALCSACVVIAGIGADRPCKKVGQPSDHSVIILTAASGMLYGYTAKTVHTATKWIFYKAGPNVNACFISVNK